MTQVKQSAWSELKQLVRMMFSMPILWLCVFLFVVVKLFANFQQVMTWLAKGTPFAFVEDWFEFLGFVLVYSMGNLVEGLCKFFQVCS